MTTKIWDGSDNAFDDGRHWSLMSAPQPGDVAVIDSGTVGVSSAMLEGLTIQLNGAADHKPILILNGSTLAAGSKLLASANSGQASINAVGAVTNAGLISFTGSSSARFATRILDASANAPGRLTNVGSIASINASSNIVAGTGGQILENNGAISAWNPTHGVQNVIIGPAIAGTGAIIIDAYAKVELVQAVGAGQTVQFLHNGAGRSSLQLDAPRLFQGAIEGFAATDAIILRNVFSTSADYVANAPGASSGVLTIRNGGEVVATLAMNGVYQTSDFGVATTDLGGGQGYTQITTSKAPLDQAFKLTNVTLGLSSSDAGVAYDGPVEYLQRQFFWRSPDAVAIRAETNNVFLHGGSAGDALAVSGGRNVLDGGGGSNFLVGADGVDDGEDTFFVDGRGGVETWSTIVNFHPGDQATIFGFHPGLSTMPFTGSDGAEGAKGLTIHSELNGAGTGVNGSITFAGIDRATADAHFSITSGTLSAGTPGEVDYLLIQYNH